MLLPYDHPMLRKKLEYKELDQEGREKLSMQLLELCKQLNGVGLSANQVGIDNRVFCIKMAGYEETFFDPQIVSYSDETTLFKEGCISQAGVFITLKRPESIVIEYTDVKGERKSNMFAGITARIIQHEYDHMEGKNFLDHSSPVKKALALKQAKKKTVVLAR
jgi:peptide deformylase